MCKFTAPSPNFPFKLYALKFKLECGAQLVHNKINELQEVLE